ncbi:hypothetical protein [Streptomyces sp. NPDC005438]|uniref:hypothetical protein n=1 Tax=Streptomyces sp. NPDC005438 TaxID=3156880 RepID=UPI0033A07E5A
MNLFDAGEHRTPAERADAYDCEFFARHPGTDEYRRPTITGEHGPGLYFDGGRTHQLHFASSLHHRPGQFSAFEAPDVVAVASTPQWSIWTDGMPVQSEVSAADAVCAALVAAEEGEAA